MERLVQNYGGILIRVAEAIDGFKSKYGFWPSEICINAESLDALRSYHLTPEGYRRLNGFVKIIETDEMVIIAKGPSRRAFDYGNEGWNHQKLEVGIAVLLSLCI